jgi:hypothetical protein
MDRCHLEQEGGLSERTIFGSSVSEAHLRLDLLEAAIIQHL